MKKNAYFEEQERIVREHNAWYCAHMKLKEQIIREHGWDSEEMDAWYKEKEAHPFPVSEGARKAYRAWRSSPDDLEAVMDDFTWDHERHDFISALREAGIVILVVTNQSTGLMEDLHGYAAEGCEMVGLCTITKKENRWGKETEEQIMGIRFWIGSGIGQ
jgi:hypothetical protein